jgi:putative transposase
VFLGDDDFVERMQKHVDAMDEVNVPRAQRRRPAPTLSAIEAAHPDRNDAIVAAHATGEFSYPQIAEHFGVHFTTVGRVVRSAKG